MARPLSGSSPFLLLC
ncbi:putative Phospholipase A2 Group IIE protein, partial [Naja naja]